MGRHETNPEVSGIIHLHEYEAGNGHGERNANQGQLQRLGPGKCERFRRLVLGTWEDRYEGKRTMTLKKDGTGTMLVELSGLKATLFADHLRFDMKWAIENGHLKKQTIGGEPAGKVQAILTMMGDRVDEPILELTQDRLLLLDKDGKTKYDWRRVR